MSGLSMTFSASDSGQQLTRHSLLGLLKQLLEIRLEVDVTEAMLVWIHS